MIFFAISPCMSYTSGIMNGKVKTVPKKWINE